MKLLLLLLFPCFLQAQYSWPSWTFYRTEQSTGYTMPWIFKPDAVILLPAGNEGPSYVQLSTTVQHNGVYTFDWEYYHSADVPFENAEVFFDGVVRVLQDNTGHNVQRGTFITPYLRKGTAIGFRAHAGHNKGGEAVLVVSGFKHPTELVACLVEAYPNPTTGRIRIQLGCFDGVRKIEVWDMAGRLVSKTETSQAVYDIDIEGASGVYVVKIVDKIFKIMKQ